MLPACSKSRTHPDPRFSTCSRATHSPHSPRRHPRLPPPKNSTSSPSTPIALHITVRDSCNLACHRRRMAQMIVSSSIAAADPSGQVKHASSLHLVGGSPIIPHVSNGRRRPDPRTYLLTVRSTCSVSGDIYIA